MAQNIYGICFSIPGEHYETSFMTYGIKSSHVQGIKLEKRKTEMMMFQDIIINIL